MEKILEAAAAGKSLNETKLPYGHEIEDPADKQYRERLTKYRIEQARAQVRLRERHRQELLQAKREAKQGH